MPDPLSYKSSGYPQRTSRDRARAHGTKVGPTVAANGYCAIHGMPHADGRCNTANCDAAAEEVSSAGGGAPLPRPPAPFKLGG